MKIYQLYVVAALACAAISALVAARKRHPPVPWFFAGLILNVFILSVLYRLPRRDPALVDGSK